MYHVECTDWSYQLIEDSGLAGIIQEIIAKPGFHIDTFASSAANIRRIGKRVKNALKLSPEQAYGFESQGALNLALGAFAIGEHPRPPSYNWRRGGRKTYVWNGDGDGIFITQKITDAEEIFVPPYEGRNMLVDWSYWPRFLALALVYFRMIRPDADIRDFVEKNFIAYENPVQRALFAECLDDDEIRQIFVPPPGIPLSVEPYDERPERKIPERRSRLCDSVPDLEEMFSNPIVDVHSPQSPVEIRAFIGQDRTYFPYVMDRSLNLGIKHGTEWEGETYSLPEHVVHVRRHQGTINVRDWIVMEPEDAEDFLKACLSQYARDREQVPEIVDLFTWGAKLDAEMTV